ncbi:hypothetical protein K469DRAFT_744632 [Zopfia rhizophila CBS 207.26]|uniref:Uncharacterized protein n=1 Tax=Zopfia rhizophila CBS 207.26 TaxID=1314779 RepID=A0A6A6EVQ5_9PEZI|nr:hypothetical protein K469DRAFT_744632 [Zopfia rhizophila CBS 207.26]
MQLTSLFFVATLSIPLVYADFLVLTDPRLYAPTEIPQIDPDDSVKWVISVASNIDAAWSSYKTAEATRPVHTSAQSAVEEFVATATISGIPPEITDPTIIAKFLAVPDWYSELPKEVRDYKESEANMLVYLVREWAVGNNEESTSRWNPLLIHEVAIEIRYREFQGSRLPKSFCSTLGLGCEEREHYNAISFKKGKSKEVRS